MMQTKVFEFEAEHPPVSKYSVDALRVPACVGQSFIFKSMSLVEMMTQNGPGSLATFDVEKDGKEYKMTTFSKILQKQFNEMESKGKIPFRATIIKTGRYYSFK